jgi:hypothetical protein
VLSDLTIASYVYSYYFIGRFAGVVYNGWSCAVLASLETVRRFSSSKDVFKRDRQTGSATHDSLQCQRCAGSASSSQSACAVSTPQVDPSDGDDLSTWSHHVGSQRA